MTGIYLENIDFQILNEQRLELVSVIWDMPDSILWGIVDMLDMMIDKHERNY